MEFSMRRVNALLKKEIKDISKNVNVLFMCIMPLVFAVIYANVFKGLSNGGNSAFGKTYILELCVYMNLVLVAGFVTAMLIAEEKEKNTMRTLMMSGVSPVEFLLGKAIITLIMSVAINIAMFFIMGMEVQHTISYIILTTLVTITMIELGAVVGIIAENQMATSTVGMPIFMAILMIPILANISHTIKEIARFLPNYNMAVLMKKIFLNKPIGAGDAFEIFVIIVWIILAAAVFGYTYSKKRLD
ncbi:ABC transporter permease [Clostridium oryzae]|uniref:ABC-2 family transporter protein n=1 Tax=Clostridium oryzae TaxID=1450648 RepID=A0A1V4IT47_9CLOT|nr:ABC transporter permease [Clostridium oryzae]OPJ63083.1 ABC-2 family transporter protein [Clostridium oryzae]